MNFDFYSQYQQYSIPQLLEILREPQNYQEAAIQAAQAVLAERNPVAVDAERERLYAVPEKIEEASEASIFDETEPIYNPRHVLLMRVVVIGILAYYSVALLIGMLPLIRLMGATDPGVEPLDLIFAAVTVAVYAVPCILLLLGKRAGWYLGMGLMVIDVVLRICFVFSSMMPDSVTAKGAMPVQLLHLVMAGTVCFLLWTPALRDRYRISDRGLRLTIWICVVLGLSPMLIRYIMT